MQQSGQDRQGLEQLQKEEPIKNLKNKCFFLNQLNRYTDNIQLNCTKKDAAFVFLGVLPFIPASLYIFKIIKNIKINLTGIRYWNPARVKQEIKNYYGLEVI